jgi:copper(I)-binding protein
MGAVYLDITNDQEESIELIGVSTPVADRAEVHESFTVDGMMKMRRKENLAFPTGKQVRFAPGGLHIMLMGLKVPLVAGEEFQLTLHFQGQPDLILQVPVMPVTQATYPE